MFQLAIFQTLLFLVASVAAINNTIVIIGNAETPSLHRRGLTPVGKWRVDNCIPQVFADFGFGLIATCTPSNVTGVCTAAYQTAAPLAASLGLPIDTSCGTGEESEDDCLSDLLIRYSKTSTKPVLVVWNGALMDDLLENLDLELPEDEDEDNEDEDEDDEGPGEDDDDDENEGPGEDEEDIEDDDEDDEDEEDVIVGTMILF
ncbi:hypothetical protein CPB85DRAFT_1438130 [Mucidula mucida]|nr:hypothetical protein CPB85DRAFT_1438130 [Mucidula mucida]